MLFWFMRFLIFDFLSFCVFNFCVVAVYNVCNVQALKNEWVYHFHSNNLPTAKFTVAFYKKIIYAYHFKKVIVWANVLESKLHIIMTTTIYNNLIDSKKNDFSHGLGASDMIHQIKKFGCFYILNHLFCYSGIRTW